MIDEKFVFVAVAFILFGDFTYLIYTIKGKVKPNRVTWFLWALAPLVAFAAQFKQGVGLLSLTTFAFGGLPLLIFFDSFLNKKAYWKLTKFDLICGALAIVGLVLWKVTQVGNWAIFFAIASDGLAAVTLFTIKQWDFAHYAFPMYIFSVGFILFLLIRFKLGRKIQSYA